MRASPARIPWSATDAIKELILTEGLRPGDPMPTELELSERLGAGRSTIREAMRTLSTLDIVEVRHGHGTYVGNLSLSPLVNGLIFRARFDASENFQTLKDVLQTRIALDLAVSEDLVATCTGKDTPELDALVEAMMTKAEAGVSFAEEDRKFHLILMEEVGNRLFSELVEAFWQIQDQAQPYLGVAPGAEIIETARAHGTMLDAAKAGDVEGYRQAVLAHYAPLGRAVERARKAANSER